MKIKNLKKPFLIIITIFTNFIYSNSKTANLTKNNQSSEFDINKYTGIHANETPSQFAAKSLEDFFTSNISIEINSAKPKEQKENKQKEIEKMNTALGDYIKKIYNSKGYSNYISQNCADLIILIKMVEKFKLKDSTRSYVYTIIKLFNDKLKESEIIDSTMVAKLLKDLPHVVQKYLEDEIDIDKSLSIIKKSLQKSVFDFSSKSRHSQDTYMKNFMNEVSLSLSNLLEIQEEKIRLQQLIVRLIENCLSKMYWSRTRYETFSPSFIQIGNRILTLVETKIIDHADDYDSLMKSVVCAACKYLDIFAWTFPLEFFDEIEDHIVRQEIPFLEEPEVDDFIKTKKEIFIDYLVKAKTKALAYHRKGIMPSF